MSKVEIFDPALCCPTGVYGPDSLPVTIVDGKITKDGVYPTNEDLAEWFGVNVEELSKKQTASLKIDLK